MTTPLSALVSIISSGVQSLESTYSKHGSRFPSLDEPYKPGALSDDPAVVDTTHLIVAAAAQLIAAVRSPEETIREFVPSMFISSSLAFTVDTNVPDILHEAGPQGLHAKDLASKTGTSANHLARVLRFLATRHVFREVTPDVFTNNRVSSVLVKNSGKTVAELQKNPMNRYDSAGTAAFVGHICDEGLKSSAFMVEYLKDPTSSVAPFNMALNTKSSIWEWFEQPGNDWRLRRFMAVMTHDGSLFQDSVFTEAIDWKALSNNSVVVDVGGNLGTVTLTLAKTYPHLNYIVQDLPKVIPGAEGFWKAQYPAAIADGRVKLQGHDFFQPQPVKSAAVYFTRFILHDWADPENIKILKNIRAAASPSSKLVLFEFCVPYACPDPDNTPESSGSKPTPYPLLANLGMGGAAYPTFVDMQMLTFFNGQERTLGGFTALGKATGWKIESMKQGKPATFVFAPV
ncbi:S-adenosyl-L-methionine-dependent methyltransferase [Gautieria morchelliformis]|nr:S-adenosyl-L-methionine-dependent methyltransferase [Gautieria morchelliformis]